MRLKLEEQQKGVQYLISTRKKIKLRNTDFQDGRITFQ